MLLRPPALALLVVAATDCAGGNGCNNVQTICDNPEIEDQERFLTCQSRVWFVADSFVAVCPNGLATLRESYEPSDRFCNTAATLDLPTLAEMQPSADCEPATYTAWHSYWACRGSFSTFVDDVIWTCHDGTTETVQDETPTHDRC